MRNLRLMVVGHGRHGKDTVCEMLQDYGFTFTSSSMEAAEVVFEIIQDKYNYKSLDECYQDRHNHREEWFDIITNFNQPDRTQLARRIYNKVDVYCGMRNREEFQQCKESGVFDVSIWVDASKRKPIEGNGSMEIEYTDCDLFIDNNGTLQQLEKKVKHIVLCVFMIEKQGLKEKIEQYFD